MIDESDKTRERAISIFSYLRALAQLRHTPVRDIDKYPRVIWFDDLPQEKGCHSIAWQEEGSDSDEVWLEVERIPEPPIPLPPPECAGWFLEASLADTNSEPELQSQMTTWAQEEPGVEKAPRVLKLEDEPRVKAAWDSYLQRKWHPWLDRHTNWANVQHVYAQLFAIHQDIQRMGENYELIVGLGYLTWKHTSGYSVRRHLLAAQAALDFDAKRGSFSLRASSNGARLALELDCLDPQDRMQLAEQKAIEADISAIADTPWDRLRLDDILRELVHTLSDRGSYLDSLTPQSDTKETPAICLAPALILRRRSSRSQISALDQILANLRDGDQIPASVRLLTGELDVWRDEDLGRIEIGRSALGGRIAKNFGVFFPLPANEAQLEIVEKVEDHRGVLVQGPPGTGKSHTIANLICHFLASGRRVLVTAQTPRALKVLQEKLPEEMLPLCVSVLGNDREALANLERAVLGISSRWSNWDKKKAYVRVKNLEEKLQRVMSEKTKLEQRLRQVRESETYNQNVADGFYSGTAQQIAARVAREAERYVWLHDQPDEDVRFTLGAESVQQLRRGYITLSPERVLEIEEKAPEISSLPSEDDFRDLLKMEHDAIRELQSYQLVTTLPNYKPLREAGTAQVKELLETLHKMRTRRHEIESRPLSWLGDAVSAVLGEQDRPWYALRSSTADLLEGLRERAVDCEQHRCLLPEETDIMRLRADAQDLRKHLEQGGGFGFPGFRPAIVRRTRYLVKTVFMDGRPCADARSLQELTKIADVLLALERLADLWQTRFEARQRTPSLRVSEFEEQLEALDLVVSLSELAKRARAICAEIPGAMSPDWSSEVAVEGLAKCCEAVAALVSLEEARAELDSLAKPLKRDAKIQNAHNSYRKMIEAIEARDISSYQSILRDLRNLARDRQLLEVRDQVEENLRSLAPELAEELERTAADPIWDERLPHIADAWNWARSNSWLLSLHADQEDGTLGKRLRELSDKAGELRGELVAELAWSHCFERMTQTERQHLVAWQQAIKRVGKGTGKYVEKYRRDAQEHLDECREAIPAWIMPLYRVYETVRPEPNAFDVVIVDEASQCGPESLVVTYLGDRILIVGDDQQISPEAVGMDRSAVHHLIKEHLSDVVHADSYTVDGSLFAHGQIRYGDRIVLREHFRSMPEIIRFSNDLCYKEQPLIPLRRYPPNRLKPIVTVHVPEGVADGSESRVINRAEAARVVRAMVACSRDPRYKGKSFGVISLQGEAQARLIEQLVFEEIGAGEIEDRRLICGDAYSFQGDERDVMFLSLVAAPNRRIGALSKEADKRRFNVAASRPRDQMWLFHSVSLNDLSQSDLRYSLLRYCLNPVLIAAIPPAVSLEELREKAENQRRDRLQAPKPFESWFEVDVYLDLVTQGYRVLPQYPVAGYQIDFVIEGSTTQLAVECDGDRWHGPEAYEADAARQRILERSGWIFHRVTGSTFYRDRNKAIEEIMDAARRLGIEPLGLQGASSVLDGYCPDIHWDDEIQSESHRIRFVQDSEDPAPMEAPRRQVRIVEDRASADALTRQEQKVRTRQKSPIRRQVNSASMDKSPPVKQKDAAEPDDLEIIAQVERVSAKAWYRLSHWAKENRKLQPWQRGLLYGVARRLNLEIPVSPKQARQALIAYEAAIESGFEPEEEQ